jgi:hypothetical protein
MVMHFFCFSKPSTENALNYEDEQENTIAALL